MKKLNLLLKALFLFQIASFQTIMPGVGGFEYKTIEELVRDHEAYGEKRIWAKKKKTMIGGLIGGLSLSPVWAFLSLSAYCYAKDVVEKEHKPKPYGNLTVAGIGLIPTAACAGIGALIAHYTFEGGKYKFTKNFNASTTGGGGNQFGFLGVHHIGAHHQSTSGTESSGWGSASKGVELDSELARDIVDFCKLKGNAPTEIPEIENFIKNTFKETFPKIESAPDSWEKDPNNQANFGKVIRTIVHGRFHGQ